MIGGVNFGWRDGMNRLVMSPGCALGRVVLPGPTVAILKLLAQHFNNYSHKNLSIMPSIINNVDIYIMSSHSNAKADTKTDVLIRSGLIGSMRAMISLPFEHPFDALKTNMQAHQKNITASIKLMLQSKGWRAFYNGFSVNLIRVAIKQAYRWPLWISMQTFYKHFLPRTNEVVRQTVTGFSISFCELVIICPFERIKVWLMTTKSQGDARVTNYYNKNFSIRDLYTGFVSLLLRQGLSWSSFLASTEVTKNMMKQYRGTDHLSSLDIFYVSIPVSIINTAFIMPIDCVKTFYQQYESLTDRNSFIRTIRNMVNTYGIKGLYLGWSARLIQYTIQSVFTLIVIEELQREYEKVRRSNQT